MSLSNSWNKDKIGNMVSEMIAANKIDDSFNWIEKLAGTLGNTKEFKGITTGKINKALKGIDLENVDDVTDAVLTLSDASIWSKIRDGASEFWKMLKPMIPAIGTLATVVAAAAIPALIGYSNTFGQLSEKAEESQAALSATSSEMASMQSTIDSNRKKLEELNSTEASQKDNAVEIKNLERQNAVLEAQLALKQDIYDLQQKQATQDAVRALTMPQQYQTGMGIVNGELAPTYEYKDILTKTEEDITQLENLKQKQIDLNNEIDGINDGSIKGNKNDIAKKQREITNLESEINSLESIINQNKLLIAGLYESLFDSLTGEVIPGNELLVSWIENIVPSLSESGNTLSSEMQTIADQYSSFVDGANIDEERADGLKSRFENWLKGLDSNEEAILTGIKEKYDTATWSLQDWQEAFAKEQEQFIADSDFDLDVPTEQSGLDTVKSAMAEAASATGLMDASIASLSKRYSELSGFDAEKLFENTSSGVRLNAQELKRLEQEYESIKTQEIADEFSRLNGELKRVNEEIEAHGDGPLKDDLKAEKDAILDDIDALERLKSQYEGITSAYNEWVNAMNSNQPGSMYDSIVDANKQMKQAYRNQEYGNTALQEYLEMMTGADFSDATNGVDLANQMDAAWEQMGQKIEGTSYSLNDFLKGGQAGCNNFLKAVEQINSSWAKFDAKTDSWELNFNKEELAAELGTTVEFIDSVIDKLKIFGFDIQTVDAESKLDQLLKKAQELKSALQEGSIDINFDTDDPESELEKIKNRASEISVDPETNAAELEYLATAAEALYTMMDQPILAEFEADGAISDTEQLTKNLIDAENAAQAAADVYGEGSTQWETAQKSVAKATKELEQHKNVAKETATADDSETQSSKIDYDVGEITLPEDVTAEGTINYNVGDVAVPEGVTATGTINYELGNVATPNGGGGSANGTAHALGTALAGGNWGTAPGGKTLVGELGEEIVVNPHTGRWYTVGSSGAEFTDIPKDAIVFNHLQSKALLENGHIFGRGKALVGGTALSDSTTGSGVGLKGYSGSGGSGSKSSNSSSDSDDMPDPMDWIEILIDRIERGIDKIARIAESAFKNLTTRTSATFDEIKNITKEIEVQQQAYDRYMQEAEAVGLQPGTISAKSFAQNGAIEIIGYSEESQEKIDNYLEWYEKALDAADAIEELNEKIAELYVDHFESIQENFENQLDMLEHSIASIENGIDIAEESGRLRSTEYYKMMQDIERDNIATLEKERDELQKAFNVAMESGQIQEGSSAWYEMKAGINEVNEAIDEANLSIIECANSIREIEWEHFDYMLDRIKQLTSESDFLIDLMGASELYDKSGKLTETGMATAGLHAMNYNVFMANADSYAEELKNLDAAIAEDPYNTDLIKRREELLELQQESILAAQDEKEAIKSLIEEGIDLELESLQGLIDKYSDALDSAKDLYDYQNKIDDHVSEISTLRKQLSSYDGDDSEETRAIVQKLKLDLKEAEKNLEETEYDQYINDQKKLLDDMYTEYETILNERLDNIDALMEEMIGSANANAASIMETISKEAQNVGYAISGNMQSVWGDTSEDAHVLSYYSADFSEKLTTTNSVLSNIEKYVSSMVDQANSQSSNVNGQDAFVKPEEKDTYIPVDITVKYDEEEKSSATNSSGGSSYSGGEGSTTKKTQQKNKGENVIAKPREEISKEEIFRGNIKADLVYSSLPADIIAVDHLSKGIDYVSHNIADASGLLRSVCEYRAKYAQSNYGDINVTIPIEHVSDYNDFVNQLRDDKKFEKLVQSITIDPLVNKSSMAKNTYRW